MSDTMTWTDFLKGAEKHLMKALDAIASVLDDEAAPAATRLRAAFGIIELVGGRSNAEPKKIPASLVAAVQTIAASPLRTGEKPKDRYARQRREKAAARAAAMAAVPTG